MNSLDIVSLGANCSLKQSIRHFLPKQEAFPFDWIITINIDKIIKFIETKNYDEFTNFSSYHIYFAFSTYAANENEKKILNNMNQNLLRKLLIDYNSNLLSENEYYQKFKNLISESVDKLPINCDKEYLSKHLFSKIVAVLDYNGIKLFHDHHINIHWKETKEKYDRRFARFIELYNTDKTILFIRYSPDQNEDINALFDVLKKNFKKFYLLVLYSTDKFNDDTIQDFKKINDSFYTYEGKLICNKYPYLINIFKKFLNQIGLK